MGTEHMYYFVPVPDWWLPGALIRSWIFGAALWILLLILPHPNCDEVAPVCLATELHWFFMSSLTVKLNMVAQWSALLPHSKRVAGLNPGPSRVCSVWSFSPCGFISGYSGFLPPSKDMYVRVITPVCAQLKPTICAILFIGWNIYVCVHTI